VTPRSSAAARPLGDEQVEAFVRDGYVVVDGLFTEAELTALRDACDRIVELSLNVTAVLGRRHPRLDARVHDDGTVTVRKIQPVDDLDDRIAALAADERVLGPLRQLMGDEPVLMEEKLNPKQTVDTRHLDLAFLAHSSFNREIGLEGFHLHHDWGYYRQQGYPEDTLSSALAIDDCAGRGPLRVVPGSHRLDVPLADPDPESGSGVVADGVFTVDDLVPVDAPAGSLMIFHSKLVHDSEPNRSGEPRRVMIYSHYPQRHDPHAEPDRRNGPVRAYARSVEQEYRDRLTASGQEPPIRLR
jgi:ectoine hydroxylase